VTISPTLLLLLAFVSAVILCGTRRRTRTLVVGTSPLARKVVGEITARLDGRYVLAGIVDDTGGTRRDAPVDAHIVGPLNRLDTIIDDVSPDRIVVALTDRRGRLPMLELLEARLRGIEIEDGVRFYERLSGKIAIEALTPDGLISPPGFRRSRVNLAAARAVSLVTAAIALVVFAPLFVLIALAITLDTPGPIFFVQDRVGLRGKRLRMLKFRTMHPARLPPSEWAGDNGSRITRVGKWLRRYHLDEMPQLINILRGEMNLVGPRPHPVRNFDLFMENIPYYWLRTVVRPGLTGWAQVRQGYANGLAEEIEKMRYDLYYIKHMSIWLDLRILLETLRIVLSERGSAAKAGPIGSGAEAAATPTGRSPSLVATVSTIARR